jgi:hypothetical protein
VGNSGQPIEWGEWGIVLPGMRVVDEHPILGIKYLLDKKLKPFLQINFYFVNFGNICVEVSIPRWSPNPKEIILAGRAGFDLGLTCLTTFF